MALRSLIVDDNSHFLQAARDLLQREGIEVVGVCSTSAEAVDLAARLRPDVALVDIDLGSESGFTLARQLAGGPGPKASRVILISTYAERDFAELIVQSPAVGFLSKSDLSASAIEELLERTNHGGVEAG
jgi:DNA-binding NarL/FixJ family response regulator